MDWFNGFVDIYLIVVCDGCTVRTKDNGIILSFLTTYFAQLVTDASDKPYEYCGMSSGDGNVVEDSQS